MLNSAAKQSWIARHRHSLWVRYGGATIVVWVALSLWTFSPLLHRHAYSLFLAAVLFTTRFLGFGPAIFSSFLSTVCLDVFVYHVFSFSAGMIQGANLERLLVFAVVAVFAGSMARQRTRAETLAERSIREMAAIVECSNDAIFSTDTHGLITSWNRAAENLFGYSPDEAVGMPAARLTPPTLAFSR